MDSSPLNRPTETRRWRTRLILVLIAALGLPLGVTILRLYPPGEYGFYPQCPLRLATGFHCSGCGATRSIHALLTGQIRQAFAYNALFTLLLPFLLTLAIGEAYRQWTGRSLFTIRLSTPVLIALAIVTFAFGIVRNFDIEPFRQLAPHTITPAKIDEPN